MSLAGKTLFITGASRGIGLAIALRAAKDGANIAIAAKTVTPHPKLEGTIYSAAEAIEAAGGKALPLATDIRDDTGVATAIKKTAEAFGGIDIVVNNASAINLAATPAIEMKRFDLMHQINARGTFLVTKLALPYLEKAANPHVLMLSPPLDMKARWFAPHLGYSMAKFGMSLCVLGFAEEFRGRGIAVNALWPRTTIATAAIKNLLGGEKIMRASRSARDPGRRFLADLQQAGARILGQLSDRRYVPDFRRLHQSGEVPGRPFRAAAAGFLRAGGVNVGGS